MANPEHLAILKQGVVHWNRWRDEHPMVTTPDISAVDLANAKLDGANLSGVYFASAKLSEANLVAASLVGVMLWLADLRKTNLGSTDLRQVDLTGADLKEAILVGADLSGAELDRTNLTAAEVDGAGFSRANVLNMLFANIDLSTAKGLETVQHSGPSTIGIDTIHKSRGKIPEAFLRGCGVPDEFIAYIGSMVGRPIEFYSCFISDSTKDQEFADRLYADLQAKGVRCWFAPHDIRGGRKIHEQIDDAIRLHDKLLLILSEHSISSNWVKTEIANARQREEHEKKNLLFPITLAPMEEVKKWKLFDADLEIDSARVVREYFIPDFSRWKEHDSYQAALGKDLKAVGSG